jgi:hypothetical protein
MMSNISFGPQEKLKQFEGGNVSPPHISVVLRTPLKNLRKKFPIVQEPNTSGERY